VPPPQGGERALEKPLGFIAGATQEQAKRANLAGNISLI